MAVIDQSHLISESEGDFDWDYGKDYSSYRCCSIRSIVKLFCIGDRNGHWPKEPSPRYGSYQLVW